MWTIWTTRTLLPFTAGAVGDVEGGRGATLNRVIAKPSIQRDCYLHPFTLSAFVLADLVENETRLSLPAAIRPVTLQIQAYSHGPSFT